MGIYGQGTLALSVVGDGEFDGSIKRLKPKKGGGSWGPWTGDLNFEAKLKGSLIAEASGYLEYPGASLGSSATSSPSSRSASGRSPRRGSTSTARWDPDRRFQVDDQSRCDARCRAARPQQGGARAHEARARTGREDGARRRRRRAAGLSRTLARAPLTRRRDDDEAAARRRRRRARGSGLGSARGKVLRRTAKPNAGAARRRGPGSGGSPAAGEPRSRCRRAPDAPRCARRRRRSATRAISRRDQPASMHPRRAQRECGRPQPWNAKTASRAVYARLSAGRAATFSALSRVGAFGSCVAPGNRGGGRRRLASCDGSERVRERVRRRRSCANRRRCLPPRRGCRCCTRWPRSSPSSAPRATRRSAGTWRASRRQPAAAPEPAAATEPIEIGGMTLATNAEGAVVAEALVPGARGRVQGAAPRAASPHRCRSRRRARRVSSSRETLVAYRGAAQRRAAAHVARGLVKATNAARSAQAADAMERLAASPTS